MLRADAIAIAAKEPPTVARFWSKVDKSGECWVWTGTLNKKGYGEFNRRAALLAHRFSWTVANGPILNGLFVCHHCDNPVCVRLDHLFLGTQRDNMHDMYKKGRAATNKRYHAKLTAAEVLVIRRIGDRVPHVELGRVFGVDRGTILRAFTRRSWKRLA